MKKNYFLTLILTLFISSFSFGQVFITELADPNDDANARYIELYNAGASAVDLNNWRIDKYTNASATVSQTLTLTGTIAAGGFYIIATGPEDSVVFDTWGITPNQWDPAANDVAGSNGDDNLELYNDSGTLIDQFGVPGEDGTGTPHEFEDGRAERKASVTSGNPTWDVNEWNIDNDSGGGAGAINKTGFDPGAWIGTVTTPTLTISSPSNGQIFDASTTDVPITLSVANFTLSGDAGGGVSDNSGDGYIVGSLTRNGVPDAGGSINIFSLTPDPIGVSPGDVIIITGELVDNSGNSLNPKVEATATFSVSLPCDLVLGAIDTTCDASTTGTDTFNGSIAFTGGNTGTTYTIIAPNGVLIGGDDPNTVASGTITFIGMTEGINYDITITGDPNTSSCDYSRTLYSPTCVAFPIVETFNYSADTDLIASANWQDGSTSNPPNNIQVKTGTLTNYYTASEFPDPTNNMVSLVGGGSDPYIKFNEGETGIIYASFLVQVNNMDNFKTTTSGGYFAVLTQPNGSFAARVWVKDVTAGTTNEGLTYNLGISTGSSGTFHTSFTANIVEPVFVVMAYDFSTNEAKLWVVPDAATFEAANAPTPDLVVGGGTATSLGRFYLRQDSTAETPSMDFDELRISNNWADVTPKGATAGIGKNTIDGFAAYPNPVNDGKLTIRSSNIEEKNITIYNVLGKRVFSQNFTGLSKQLDVSHISSGIYIMKVLEGEKVATKKLVIK